MRHALLILAVAFTAGASAVSFSFLQTAASAGRSSQDPCSAGVTRTTVTRLIAAINEGDIDLADQLVAKGDAFIWFSVGRERIGEAAKDRRTLRDYLAARHAQGERLRLLGFRYQGVSRAPVHGETRRHANFSMVLVRTARDYPSAPVLGKGATDCDLRPSQVAVWSLGSACQRGSVPARINGMWRCLRAGQRCAKRFDRQYHRYGFHCHTGRLRADRWIALESRPLHLPQIAPGAPCPRSSGRQVTPYLSVAYGDGPAYAVGLVPDSEGIVHYGGARHEGGWYYVKVLWAVDPAHLEPMLVRGRQIDGSNRLRFGHGPNPSKELRTPTWGTVGDPPWGARPSSARIRAPGCYAFQADGKTFSTVIVFQAAP
jgi:hypothetical protein